MVENYPNLYAIIISIAIILWIQGIVKLIEYYVIVSKNPVSYMLNAFIGFLILYFNNNTLLELLNIRKKNENISTTIMNSAKSLFSTQ